MSELMCPNPEFLYDEARQWWRECIRCGRGAWYHEQADPSADIRAVRAAIYKAGPYGKADLSTIPPHMLSQAEWEIRDVPS